MFNFSAENYIKRIILAILIFYTVFAQGGFFVIPLIILNVFFLLAIVLSKGSVKWDIPLVFFCIFFAIMAVSAVFSLSFDAAVKELLKYALFPLAYSYFKQNNDEDKIETLFYSSFVVLMAFGMLGILGISPIDGMVTNLGGRLQSFFQYANTTALAMGIGAFYATEKFRNTKKWLHLIMAGLFFGALVLTLSRVSFVVFILCYLLYVFQFVRLKIKLLLLGGFGVFMTVLVATSSRIAQISIFAPTLVERYISYFDALHMLRQSPFGVGLGNWQFLQFYYQSAPYDVLYIHNAYLQMALDGGFLALLVFIMAVGLSFIKAKKGVHFYIGIFILINSFFEVHFNFGIIIIYFMFLLATLNKNAQPLKIPSIKYIKYAAVLPLIVLLVLFASNALASYGTALERRGQINEARQAFANAHSINPLSDGLHIHQARVAVSPQYALYHLYIAHNANSFNGLAIYMLVQNHIMLGNYEQAYIYADKLLQIFPFSTRNQNLLKEIILMLEKEQQPTLLYNLEARIKAINDGINPLFRHIEGGL